MPKMISDQDAANFAALLLRRHGKDAPILAAMQADKFLAQGEMRDRARWIRIMKAIDALMEEGCK